MAMAVEHRVALAAGYGAVVPRLARQVGTLDRLARGLRRRLVAIVAALHGVGAATTAAGSSVATAIPVASGTRVAIRRGQVVVELLEIVAWN